MKKKMTIRTIALIIIIAFFVFFNNMTGNAAKENTQKVVIGMKDWIYSPMVISIKAGIPTKISLDDSVRGCFRDLVIPELGIRKYLETSKDSVEVTFEKGEYTYACSMFMGQGKIIAK
jgi:plastocyanin domain-containing protein